MPKLTIYQRWVRSTFFSMQTVYIALENKSAYMTNVTKHCHDCGIIFSRSWLLLEPYFSRNVTVPKMPFSCHICNIYKNRSATQVPSHDRRNCAKMACWVLFSGHLTHPARQIIQLEPMENKDILPKP